MPLSSVTETVRFIAGTAKLLREAPSLYRKLRIAAVQIFPRSERAHHARLRERLRRMPFLYRGVETSIERDYVTAAVTAADLRTLLPFGFRNARPLPPMQAADVELGDLGAAQTIVWKQGRCLK